MKALKIFGWVLVGIAGICVGGLVLGIGVQLLWNWLMPALFGLPEITYWQAVGLFVLCHLMLGSHGARYERHGKPKQGQPGHELRQRVISSLEKSEEDAHEAPAEGTA